MQLDFILTKEAILSVKLVILDIMQQAKEQFGVLNVPLDCIQRVKELFYALPVQRGPTPKVKKE